MVIESKLRVFVKGHEKLFIEKTITSSEKEQP